MNKIRAIQQQDLTHLKAVIDSNELFPSELLDDMVGGYFNDASTQDIWLTLDVEDTPVAVAYCAPERMTQGTYNLYLIAIAKHLQGKGYGRALMNHIENMLYEQGVRILIVETSGLPGFELTRKFYDQCGYTREAVIREFYQEGEDKVVFWKKLN